MALNKEQYEKIDILKLYAKGSANGWNEFLAKCRINRDVSKLISVRKGLQLGMADVANKKLNDDRIDLFFVRLQRSIENELKAIFREVHPELFDNPLAVNQSLNKLDHISSKRRRDREFERFLRRHSY